VVGWGLAHVQRGKRESETSPRFSKEKTQERGVLHYVRRPQRSETPKKRDVSDGVGSGLVASVIPDIFRGGRERRRPDRSVPQNLAEGKKDNILNPRIGKPTS